MEPVKPTGYELHCKDLYHSCSGFKYYCDYYKTCRYPRFMFLSDFVDWCNGNDYKKHCGRYRDRLIGWEQNGKDIQSYINTLSISAELAFSCWHHFEFQPISGVGTRKAKLYINRLHKDGYFLDDDAKLYAAAFRNLFQEKLKCKTMISY